MDKIYIIAGPQQRSTSSVVAERDADWGKCVLCQEVTGEELHCSAGSKQSMDGAGYKTLADNLWAFQTTCGPSRRYAACHQVLFPD